MRGKIVLAVVFVIIAVGMIGGCNNEIKMPPPTVQSTSPTNSATNVATTAIISATFSESISPSTVNIVTFTLNDGATNVAGVVSLIGTTATFSPNSALHYGTTYTATITTGVMDLVGLPLAANYSWTFTTTATTDTTPPAVQSTFPTSGATNVATTAIISATFSEPVSSSTVNTGTFTLFEGATNVAGVVSLSGTTATFTPSSALLYGTTYTATITTGVTDLAGNHPAVNNSWTFTTTTAPDTTPPTVFSVTPTKGATNVSTHTTNISVVFSESILASSVNASTFLVSTGGTPVTGNVSLSGGNASFALASALSSNATYSATLTTGVQDLAGNALASPYNWTFTTAPAPSITTTTLPDGTETGAYSQTLAATGGFGTLTWSATGLPPWLTLNPSTGNLSGTPPLGMAGSYKFDVTVMDADGLTATKSLSLTVITGPVIGTTALPDGTTTGVYTAPTLTATGGTLPYNWSATGLPSGLSLSPTGDLTGKITAAAGNYPINVTLTDNVGVTATQVLTLVINAVPSITTASTLTAWTSGATASVTFAATDGTTPLTWISTPSPPDTWLTLTSAGVLSGTEPGNAAGTTYTFDITVTDVNGVSATQTFNLVVQ